MKFNILTAKNRTEIERCFSVLKELRPHLELEEYLSIYQEAHSTNGYELVAAEAAGKIVGVMGYRFLWDFVRGKHVYIDDLVTTEHARSQGLGATLLQYAESVARSSDCKSLRLCATLENIHAIRFYERQGWTKRSFAFTKKTPV